MATLSLFRAEAIAFQREGSRAGSLLPAPPAAGLLAALLFAGAAAMAIFLATGSYARKATVSGYLAPTLGVAKIQPPRAGIVVALHVVEGQSVEAGAPLVTVHVGETNDRGGDVDDTVMAALRQQRSTLLDQAALEQRRAEEEAARLRDQIAGFATELAAQEAELSAQRARERVAADQVDAVRELVSRGYISVVEFKRRQDNFLAQQQNAASLTRQIAEKRNQATQQRHMLDELASDTERKVSALQGSAAEIEARLAETEGRRAYLLRAPIAGRVSSLQARVGLPADPTIPQLSIVPEGSALKAELLVPARAIGFVEPGQRVRVAYEAFPFQRFGFHGGHVESVSRSLLRPTELVGPMSPTEPSFRVTVALDRQTIDAAGRELPLGADMALKADIEFDRRSLLAWLLAPVLDVQGRWQ
jgi:membrane fusion protein